MIYYFPYLPVILQSKRKVGVSPQYTELRIVSGGALGNWDRHGDGFVELPPSWLQCHNWAKCGFVTKDLSHHIHINGLSLKQGTKKPFEFTSFLIDSFRI